MNIENIQYKIINLKAEDFERVQRKLFALGFTWQSGHSHIVEPYNKSEFIHIEIYTKGFAYGLGKIETGKDWGILLGEPFLLFKGFLYE